MVFRIPPVAVLVLLLGGVAAAQSFPPDSAFRPLRCRSGAMVDPVADVATALDAQDLVGSAEHPVSYRASDANHLFFRLRLNRDPAPGAVPNLAAWGLLLDTNDDLRSYEVAVRLSGAQLALARNGTALRPDHPSDPPDDPPVAVYPFAQNVRVVAAPGTQFGGDGDLFLDLAVPWTDLALLGLDPGSSIRSWAATSAQSSQTLLDGDLACDDGGPGRLRDAFPARDVLSPGEDSDDDGFSNGYEVANGNDPNDAANRPLVAPGASRLEGGGGCTASGDAAAGSGTVWLAFLIVALLAFRIRGGLFECAP